MFTSSYIQAYKCGYLLPLRDSLLRELGSCTLCPRHCQVNRLEGEKGICKTGRQAMVSSYHPHFGEERCLVGRNGSGTIFFTNCNLLCSFCQNYSISHQGNGEEVTDEELAAMMLHLQKQGCHNINFVTPSHVIPQIVSAVAIACEQGLNIPLVYNSGGYDSVESIQMLEGIIDIYMPDLKFSDPVIARETCNAPDYFEVAKKAIREMHRQVGDLKMNSQGIATRGLLVRHLVMPEDAAGTGKIMEFLANEISKDTFVNIMDQYYPCGETWKKCKLGRAITYQEYLKAMNIASSAGLSRFG